MCCVCFTRETCCCVFLCCAEKYTAAHTGLSPVTVSRRSPGAGGQSLSGTR
ncbi:unnamed protein product [Staurois parvus]|uniref:Secreted protein n=1 Tax=Staurois parvus TaxID=386267 RepID=A0ABN9D552_9NEOB|nr:unnamed protein product [Staurois parvus]